MNRILLRTFIVSILLLVIMHISAQELTVKSFTVAPTDISASQYPRKDLTGHPCGLVKVQLAVAGAQFEGNVIQPVENKTGEYWVYMTEGSKELVVKTPSTVPLHVIFGDHQINGIQPKATYVLTLVQGNGSVAQMQTLTIQYTPTSAFVLIDSKPYQDASGVISVQLPVGSHSYSVAAVGYGTSEGSVKLNPGTPGKLRVDLERETTGQTIVQQPVQQSVQQPTQQSATSTSSQTSQTTASHVATQVLEPGLGQTRKEDAKIVEQSFYLYKYSLVVASFSILKNAQIVADRVQNVYGHRATIVKNVPGMYRVILMSNDIFGEVLNMKNTIRQQYPDAWIGEFNIQGNQKFMRSQTR